MNRKAYFNRVGRAALSGMTDEQITADPAHAFLVAFAAARGALLALQSKQEPTE